MSTNPSYRAPTSAKAFVAALVPLVLAAASFISTGLFNGPELVLVVSAVVTAGLVWLVPNTPTLTTAKAVVAGVTPLIVAVVAHAPLSDIVRIGEPLLSALLVYATSNSPVAQEAVR